MSEVIHNRMESLIPEKAGLLDRLRQGGFNVPEFIYIPAQDFETENFEALEHFLRDHQESYKVIVRSGHPLEQYYKGGTFDSLETYADVGGIVYARKRIIKSARTAHRLSLLRQRRFKAAPDIDLDEMGVIVIHDCSPHDEAAFEPVSKHRRARVIRLTGKQVGCSTRIACKDHFQIGAEDGCHLTVLGLGRAGHYNAHQ